jgi:ligand-binding sensor domain-containing protein/signal transduction histidine kinase
MPKNSRAFLPSLIVLCFFAAGYEVHSTGKPPANSAFIIKSWDTEDGLPRNSVTSITQSRDGYLWLGTPNGLVRFDGVRFSVFDENNTPGLPGSHIVSLFEDSQGNLWVGTETAGVVVFKDGKATPTGLGQGSRESRMAAAAEDATGAVWLLASNGQLWRQYQGNTSAFLVEGGRPSDYRTLIADGTGKLWIGMDWQVAALETTLALDGPQLPLKPGPVLGGTIHMLLPARGGGFWCLADGRVQKWKENLSEADREVNQPEVLGGWYPWRLDPWGLARVSAASEDRQGNLIVGTLGAGLYWYNSHGEAARITTENGLAGNYIFSLHVDREGSLWVGTDGGGLCRVNRPVFSLLEETSDLVVQSVAEDSKGGLWLGFNGPTPAGYWKDGIWTQHNLPVRTVFVDRSDRVWGGTSGGLFRFDGGRFQPVAGIEGMNKMVMAIYQDSNGHVWAGLRGGLARWDEQAWKLFTKGDGLSSDIVRAIAGDSQGNLWIGTEGGGLNRFKDGQFRRIEGPTGGLPGDRITSLLVDEEDVLWIGTDGGGLVRFREGNWTQYTRRHGLASNSVGYLVEDGQDNLWIGSNAGLMRVPKKGLTDLANGSSDFLACRTYGKPDGLPNHECTSGSQPGARRTQDGKLWFPTIKGLVWVNPSQLKPNPHPPPVTLDLVLIDGQLLERSGLEDRPVVVPAGREQLEIHYSGLNLTAPGRVRFKYRMEGHETAWVEAADSRVARYSKLPPGNYRFQVTASNEDGVWNETGSSLAFTVLPPFWRTWWFFGSATFFLLGSVSAGIYYLSTQKLKRQLGKLKQEEALERERARIARDIHDQLGASLTQMALLGELLEGDKDSPEEVGTHAQQICQTARDTTRVLDEIVWAVNPSNDTLDGLMTYICKYAQEYLAVAGLKYRMDVPAELPLAIIPPDVRHNVFLAAKEAVTNVVRHARASSVWIRLQTENSRFILQIEDDGRGLNCLDEGAARGRNGLRNMGRRMEEIGGSFSIMAGPGGGTVVQLTTPLRFKTDRIAEARAV